MSSMLRTLQKRALKRAGYRREKTVVRIIAGMPHLITLGKGEGSILNSAGDTLGRRWPVPVGAASAAA